MPSQHNKSESSLFCRLPEKRTTAQLEEPQTETKFAAETAELVSEPAPVAKRESGSTLIEFPKQRQSRDDEWRDDLRERVRAARERKNGETETPPPKKPAVRKTKSEQPQSQPAVINLKSNTESRPTTRLIARALERVERSRQVHQSGGATAVALAPAFEPEDLPGQKPEPKRHTALKAVPSPALPQTAAESKPKPAPRKIEMPVIEDGLNFAESRTDVQDEKPRAESKIETVFQPLEAKIEAKTENSPPAPRAAKEPRKLSMLSDADADNFIESQMRVSAAIPAKKPSPRSGYVIEQEIAPRPRETSQPEEIVEDYAPLGYRFAAGLADAFLCAAVTMSLFAIFAPAGFFSGEKFGFSSAVTILGVFALVKFVYLTAAVVLTETTIGGWFFSLRTVHAEDGSAATAVEAALNSAGYLLTLAFAGIGFIPVLFSTEKRAVHDLISGTVVIRES